MRTRPGPGTLALVLYGLLSGATPTAIAQPPGDRPPEGYDDIARELRLGRDALRGTLEDTLPDGLALVELDAGYLPEQGLLIIVDLARPWYRRGAHGLELDPDLSRLEQIPDMVHEILRELDLGLSRHEVDELQELRGLREAQRAARAEQRSLRGQLRELGRRRLRAEDGEAQVLDRRIGELEAELAAAAARERDLEQRIGSRRGGVPQPETTLPDPPPAAVDVAVTEALCRHGAAFELPGDDEHVNVVVRREEGSRYYVFAMKRVRACGAGEIDPQKLLRSGLHYGG